MKRVIHKITDQVTYTDVIFKQDKKFGQLAYCKQVWTDPNSTEFGTRWLMYDHISKSAKEFDNLQEFKKAFRKSAKYLLNRKVLGVGTYKTKTGLKVEITNVNESSSFCLQGYVYKVSKKGRIKKEYNTWTAFGDQYGHGKHDYDLV